MAGVYHGSLGSRQLRPDIGFPVSDAIAEMYQTPDLSIVTSCYAYADRLHSYQLVAEACGIGRD